MNRAINPLILVTILLVFLAAKVFCCCLIKGGLESLTKKVSCSHCASKTPQGTSNGCCFLKGSPMELASNQLLNVVLPWVALFVVAFFYIKPQRRLITRHLYLNGPPGPFYAVALYIQARSIRI